MKRTVSIILIVALLLGMTSMACFAASPEVITQLADELYLHQNSFYSSYAEGDINENFFVYKPNKDVTPYLAHGNDVAGAASMSRVFRLEKEAGNTIIAATNGDYFETSTGIPIGIQIKDGIIKCSSSYSFPEIGFKADGRAIFGRSDLTITLTNKTKDITVDYINYNKALSDDGGVSVFSRGFEETNRAGKDALNVSVVITSGEARANSSIRGTVKEVFDSSSAVSLNDNELLVSIYKTSYVDSQQKLSSFEPGDEIELRFDMDKAWEDVTQAFGGKEVLMENGSLKTFSDETRAPRTAIGTKSDGTVVLYTCDGRSAGGSKGLTLTELARRMSQLGCKDAINLDGGASTQVFVNLPGKEAQEQINVDSGSSLRSCANYICFKNNKPETGIPSKLYAYPNEFSIAVDSEEKLNIKAVDRNWHTVDLSDYYIDYSYDEKLGSIEENTFRSGLNIGYGIITVSIGNTSVDIKYSVLSDWPEIEAVYFDGYLTATVKDPLGKGIEKSKIKVYLDGEEIEFSYDKSSGSLVYQLEEYDGMMHHIVITAESLRGHITRQGLEIVTDVQILEDGSRMGIDVDTVPVFADMDYSNWATKYAEYLFRQDIIAGSVKNDKRYYNPSANMTRQEFAKTIVAWYGADIEKYEETELEFDDNSAIAEWAVPYVKAAVDLGFMNGKTVNGTSRFDPNGSITRQEVMTVIGRIMGDGYMTSDLSEFTDSDQVAGWALPYVQLLTRQGIITGSNGKLMPLNPVTRAQVAKIIFEIN